MRKIDNPKAAVVQFVKYALAGGVATAVDIATFFLLAIFAFHCLAPDDRVAVLLSRHAGISVPEVTDSVRSVNALICNTLAFLVANFVCYVINRLFVFVPGRHSVAVEALLFLAVSAISFAIGTAAQTLLIALGGVSTSIAFSANLVAALAINFVARKFLIFKE